MTKTDKKITEYILNLKSFSWAGDIADHTLWGFKNAPYKNRQRAINKVNSILGKMLIQKQIIIDFIDGTNFVYLPKYN